MNPLPHPTSLRIIEKDNHLLVEFSDYLSKWSVFGFLLGCHIVVALLINSVNLITDRNDNLSKIVHVSSLGICISLAPLALLFIQEFAFCLRSKTEGKILIEEGFITIYSGIKMIVIPLNVPFYSSILFILSWPFRNQKLEFSREDLYVTSFPNALVPNRKLALLTKKYLVVMYPSCNPLDNIWLATAIRTHFFDGNTCNLECQRINEAFWKSSVGKLAVVNGIILIVSLFCLPLFVLLTNMP